MIKPVHADVPVDRAWQEGRRIYIRCGFESTLNKHLIALGAKWDSVARARYVGTVRRDLVLPLILAAEPRRTEVAAIRGAGHAVHVPFDATDIRTQAKQAGAVFDRDRKLWLLPTAEAAAVILAAVTNWTTARTAARHPRYTPALRFTPATRPPAKTDGTCMHRRCTATSTMWASLGPTCDEHYDTYSG